MVNTKYQTDGFPESGSLFTQINDEQPELTGSILEKSIAGTQEPINESIRQAISQAVKERVYGKTYN